MTTVTIRTKAVTREKLARFFPGNHELVRFLESLAQDVTVNIPDVLDPTTVTSDDGADLAQAAHALAAASQGLALRALDLAQQSNEGPPVTPVVQQGDDQPPAVPLVLPDIPDDVYALLAALRERVAVAERAIAEIKEGLTP